MRIVRAAAVAAVGLVMTAGPASAALTIVAVDPLTRQVGVAGATCAPKDFASAAVVVPGVGVAAVQGTSDPRPAQAVAEALRGGAPPGDALRTALSEAPDANDLQVGAVTFGARPTAATGSSNGERTIATNGSTASVQGAYLTGYGAAEQALSIVERPESGSLAERLLAALTITDHGGGDRRCGSQRASSAFLIVADAAGPPVVPASGVPAAKRRQRAVLAGLGGHVAADELEAKLLEAAALPRPSGPAPPAVYLSLLQPRGGFDAVTLLRQAYGQTHPAPSDTPSPASQRTLDPEATRPSRPDGVTIVVLAGVVIAVVVVFARRARTRGDDRSA